MKVRLTILGEPASKANSRQLVTIHGRPAFIKSQKARDYEKAALMQIPSIHRRSIAVPVRVTMRVFYASQRPDLDESVILDVLQDRYEGEGDRRQLVQRGVYSNDRLVREKHIFHAIDKSNPRAEIEIETLVEQGELSMDEVRNGQEQLVA